MRNLEMGQGIGTLSSRSRGITGSTLKMIAMFSMLIDHIGYFLLGRMLIDRGLLNATEQVSKYAFMTINKELYITYKVFRMIGRIAFPIFCFLLVQGFLHTRNLKKYLGRLFLFALVSEMPLDLAVTGKLIFLNKQNVYFTLFFGMLTLAAFQIAEEKKEWHRMWRVSFGLLAVLLFAGVTVLLKTDYGITGILIIATLYLARQKRTLSMGLGCAMLMRIPALFAVIPVHFYNGQRGSNIKWFFYLFYPGHILLLYLLACLFGWGGISLV